MPSVKITKTSLREEQKRLNQMLAYMPTLELKKSLLQIEVHDIDWEINCKKNEQKKLEEELLSFISIFSGVGYDAETLCSIDQCQLIYENIAGIIVPECQDVTFKDSPYSFLNTPFFVEPILVKIRQFIKEKEKLRILIEKRDLISEELRRVTIRVNLFKKRLIPEISKNIKFIMLGLAELELEAVIRSKFVKDHILSRGK